MKKRKFRVALVGCGAISRTHIRAILAAEQTVVALCDLSREKAESLAAAEGLSDVSIHTDYETMLDAIHPDIVHICTRFIPTSFISVRRTISTRP